MLQEPTSEAQTNETDPLNVLQLHKEFLLLGLFVSVFTFEDPQSPQNPKYSVVCRCSSFKKNNITVKSMILETRGSQTFLVHSSLNFSVIFFMAFQTKRNNIVPFIKSKHLNNIYVLTIQQLLEKNKTNTWKEKVLFHSLITTITIGMCVPGCTA